MRIKSLVFVSSLVLCAGYSSAGRSAPLENGHSAKAATVAVANGKFSKVKVGMYSREVVDLIGGPNDQKTYQTGKAWIPFHFGGDNYRTEYHYKGEGTLTFSGGGMGHVGSLKLIKITSNAAESGYIH
ncbi:MAG: hypothetical protein M3Y93_07305 [Pseudomonadota bacterium]|nr:hypothetical protein [Pseudomonadota bacterium]